ncbi:hypothetical protein [Burkholderia ubonensis]|uniref:hypothetical protein n=1 Tax=Burkholderia ubonensis TaxID=101571 RepID=UPI000751CCDD|nr:hypothetical protein [Burkholderia ubonensis]KVN42254.1 hypothetical protein WJ64_31980 [Burkholderia ubonensis]
MNKPNDVSQIAPAEWPELSNLSRTFDLFTPEGSDWITGLSASIHLNQCYKSFQAIDAITRILIADGVAHDTNQPVLPGYLSSGLLTAASVLSEVALGNLEKLADWCDKREDEVRHD